MNILMGNSSMRVAQWFYFKKHDVKVYFQYYTTER